MTTPDRLTRFSNRVDDYVRYRPTYPTALVDLLEADFGFAPGQTLADIGSGTGISAELFLRRGYHVCAVEPNADMRAAAEAALGGLPGFRSIAGAAEATTLPDASVDAVIAAQAFHWFDVDGVRKEFARILKPGGKVALIWNDWRDDTPFMQDYAAFVRQYALDFDKLRNHSPEQAPRIARFFAAGHEVRAIPNGQTLDRVGVEGRMLSSSYMPGRDDPRCEAALAVLREVFARHERDGVVAFAYFTRVYIGTLR